MAHYAFLNSDNIVVKVITGVDEDVIQIDSDGTPVGGSSEAWELFYENQSWHSGLTCKRTSYNGNIRARYAGIGFVYRADIDQFVAPQPFPSWSLDDNYDWQPPIPRPTDLTKDYAWFEPNQQWIEII